MVQVPSELPNFEWNVPGLDLLAVSQKFDSKLEVDLGRFLGNLKTVDWPSISESGIPISDDPNEVAFGAD